MGFFRALTSIGRRVVGGIGSVVRKVAHFAAPIARKVGDLSVPVGAAASGLAAALGHQELARQILGASHAVGHAAPHVGQALDAVGSWGASAAASGRRDD